jgi:hypothetical protein
MFQHLLELVCEREQVLAQLQRYLTRKQWESVFAQVMAQRLTYANY